MSSEHVELEDWKSPIAHVKWAGVTVPGGPAGPHRRLWSLRENGALVWSFPLVFEKQNRKFFGMYILLVLTSKGLREFKNRH